MIPNFSLLIATSESNSWAIPGFLRQLRIFYPEFAHPIFVSVPKNDIQGVTAGIPETYRSYDWSTRMLMCVRQVKTEFVLLCLEDNYLTGNVDSNRLNSALLVMEKDPSIGCIDFDVDHHNQPAAYAGIYEKGDLPLIIERHPQPMLCVSLLRTSYFRKLLRKGEDPWTYESFVYWRAKFSRKKCLLYSDAKDYPIWPGPFGGVVHGGKLLDEYRGFFTPEELTEASKPKPRAESLFLRLPGQIQTKKALYWLCRRLSIFHFSHSKKLRNN
jgi:hypothetical protein